MAYREPFVQRDQHRIYVRDHPGAEPPIILMHGSPDNLHLYDRLLPHLSPPRRVSRASSTIVSSAANSAAVVPIPLGSSAHSAV
jgi:pimeloyl-ACP methyl ester carboxylesterase